MLFVSTVFFSGHEHTHFWHAHLTTLWPLSMLWKTTEKKHLFVQSVIEPEHESHDLFVARVFEGLNRKYAVNCLHICAKNHLQLIPLTKKQNCFSRWTFMTLLECLTQFKATRDVVPRNVCSPHWCSRVDLTYWWNFGACKSSLGFCCRISLSPRFKFRSPATNAPAGDHHVCRKLSYWLIWCPLECFGTKLRTIAWARKKGVCINLWKI